MCVVIKDLQQPLQAREPVLATPVSEPFKLIKLFGETINKA